MIGDEETNLLANHGYLLKRKTMEGGKIKYLYSMGPNALPLVSAWKIEALTEKVVFLTWLLIIATVLILLK